MNDSMKQYIFKKKRDEIMKRKKKIEKRMNDSISNV